MKSLLITNQTVLVAHINLSVGSAYHNALCSTDDATIAHKEAVHRLPTLCFSELFVGPMPEFDINNTNDDGKRYFKSRYNHKASNN